MLQYCKNRLFASSFKWNLYLIKLFFDYFIFYTVFVADKMFFDLQ